MIVKRHAASRAAARFAPLSAVLLALAGCAAGGAIQPDRTVFSLDNNYQRYSYAMPIEQTFDRTVAVFKEAGYKLDVLDRATGQISGRRGATGDKGSGSDKDLKFYALILPRDAPSLTGIAAERRPARMAWRNSPVASSSTS